VTTRFVRQAAAEDAEVIAAIYNQGIEDRTATFETEPRRAEHIMEWLDKGYPVMAAGEDGVIEAFAVATPYSARACYDGVREFSVYVTRQGRGHGFGNLALSALIEDARSRGWWKLVSRIFPDNAASRELCLSLGFREVGTYEKHAQLDGEWRDVVIVEKFLGD
jgi:L-amino acid N-acyltransferase YncA